MKMRCITWCAGGRVFWLEIRIRRAPPAACLLWRPKWSIGFTILQRNSRCLFSLLLPRANAKTHHRGHGSTQGPPTSLVRRDTVDLFFRASFMDEAAAFQDRLAVLDHLRMSA